MAKKAERKEFYDNFHLTLSNDEIQALYESCAVWSDIICKGINPKERDDREAIFSKPFMYLVAVERMIEDKLSIRINSRQKSFSMKLEPERAYSLYLLLLQMPIPESKPLQSLLARLDREIIDRNFPQFSATPKQLQQ